MIRALLLLPLLSVWARALLPDEENTIKVFKDVSPSVVFVTNIAVERNVFTMDEFAVPNGAGSGFIWDKEGHIVTNYHVVQGGDAFMVTLKDHTEVQAKIVGVEPRKDIAVLKVSESLDKMRPIGVGRSDTLLVGQKTIAIGNPFGLDNTMTTGIISALGRQVQGVSGVAIRDMIQTDAAINPGNSGGPLLDSSGALIGMNTMIYSKSGSSAGIGFAVPVNFIRRIVPQIIKFGKAIQPGIGIFPLTDQQKLSLLGDVPGVVVGEVSRRGPAAEAGLRGLRQDGAGRLILGDIIVGVDKYDVKNFDDLFSTMDFYKVGDTVTVRVVREGRPHSAPVKLVNVY